MNTQTITIQENELPVKDATSMILKLIDGQICHHNAKFLSEWECNHDVDSSATKQRVEKLKKEKARLIEILRSCETEDYSVDFSLDLNVTVKSPEKYELYAMQMQA